MASTPSDPRLPVAWHPGYSIPQPPGHPFPMGKFAALGAWLAARGDDFAVVQPAPVPWEWLARVHEPTYLEALATGTLDPKAQRRIGFACTPELFNRCCLETGGTLLAVEAALKSGLACNAAGGTHHAHRDFGSGYCLINDLAVAARYALEHRGVGRVLVVDLDVHQGDGTATLLADEPRALTFSMHCRENFPARKAVSDFDLEVPRGTDGAGYLAELAATLPWLLDAWAPDLVLYDAGVDVHTGDRLGYLELSDDDLYARDLLAIGACRRRGIATACVIGGGYDVNLERLATRHATLMRAARALQQSAVA